MNGSKLIISYLPIGALKADPRNSRTHSKHQIRQIAESIRQFGFANPILIDKRNKMIAGHARALAAELLGMEKVPTICLEDLTEEQIRAYVIADNKLAENAGWDKSILAIELQHLLKIDTDFDVSITGFEVPEIDLLLSPEETTPDADDVFEVEENSNPVTQPGDVWKLGKHRILCGSAIEEDSYSTLMDTKRAAVVFVDPPYNVRIRGNVSGNGAIEHREFLMASGEMNPSEFTSFLASSFQLLARYSTPGSVHFACMDFRHMVEIHTAGKQVYDTQQFNTTTSMGRLTLNVLLSFAQFEREVTGERIRDKIAASKRKGMWMGGVVPLGYDLEDRHLVVNQSGAEHVRDIYRLYLKLGCVTKLQEYLEQAGIRSKKRVSRTGRASGNSIFSRGALYKILHNRIYLGEITHKRESYPGQHSAIIDQKMWDQVQAQFQSNLQAPRKRPRAMEQSLLMGLLYDDQGNRFTPSHANKKGRRYRYYVSQAVITNARNHQHGAVRIPALEIEELVISQLTLLLRSPRRMMDILADVEHSQGDIKTLAEASRVWSAVTEDKVQTVLPSIVKRVIVHNERIEIEIIRSALLQTVLGVPDDPEALINNSDEVVMIETAAQMKRCGGDMRLILPPDSPGAKPREVPSLIRAISRAHAWVERILRGEVVDQRSIAKETGLDERYISRIIPLAFLAPDLTEAILEGKQAPGLSLDTCLGNIPDDWVQQRTQLLSP